MTKRSRRIAGALGKKPLRRHAMPLRPRLSPGRALAFEPLESRLLLSASVLFAEELFSVVSLGDLNSAGSSSPSGFVEWKGEVYFAATDAAHGRELWKTDGTPSGTKLVADINLGTGNSNPKSLTVLGNSLCFAANDGTSGTELWACSATGTAARLKDINPGAGSSTPKSFTVWNHVLYFAANDGTHGEELWSSDGTASGTTLLKDIRSGTGSSSPESFTVLGTKLCFAADNGTAGCELWSTDGTASGTAILKDIRSGSTSSSPDQLTVVGSALYFTADDAAHGYELWRTTGTAAGTVLVKDICATAAVGSYPYELTEMNGALYFQADDGADLHGCELWKSDGTASGTTMVKDVYAGVSSSLPLYLTNASGMLYFQAEDADHGIELWASDGTASGTTRIKDIYAGTEWGDPGSFTLLDGYVFFFARDSAGGYEVWRTSGTEASTLRVADICPGAADSMPLDFFVAFDKLFISADDGTLGREPYLIAQHPNVGAIVKADTDPTTADTVRFGVTFTETVTGVDATDFDLATSGLAGAAISSVSYSGTTYSVTVSTGTGSGTLQLNLVDNDSIQDADGLPLGGGGLGNGDLDGPAYTVDRTPPTVTSIVTVESQPIRGTAVHFTVTFNESVTGVDITDFSLAANGITGAAITGVASNGTTCTVTVSTGSGDGSLQLNLVDDDSILDIAGHSLGGPESGDGDFSGPTCDVDKLPVVASIVKTDADPTTDSTVHFTVVFSEAVTGVDASDFAISVFSLDGAAITAVAGSETTYTVTVGTGTGSGTLRLNVLDDDTIVDSTGNPLGGEGAGNGIRTGPAYCVNCNLDADGNGSADALTDGVLTLRYLFDPAGQWNYSDALGAGATRASRAAIRTYLEGSSTTVLDADGNGSADALTDGILILRYLFDPAGQWNYSDALGTGATRTTRATIRAFLNQYLPVPVVPAADASGVQAAVAEEPRLADSVSGSVEGQDAAVAAAMIADAPPASPRIEAPALPAAVADESIAVCGLPAAQAAAPMPIDRSAIDAVFGRWPAHISAAIAWSGRSASCNFDLWADDDYCFDADFRCHIKAT